MTINRYPVQIGDIARADFRTSVGADNENARLQKIFGFQFRYQPARLAIALSLSDARLPAAVDELTGKPIRGDTLFGQDEADLASWIALIVQHSGQTDMSRRTFQELIAAHWARGIEMLRLTGDGIEPQIETLVYSLLATGS